MGLYRRKDSRVWWMSFTIKGRLYRESTETADRKLAEKVFRKVQTMVVENRWFERPRDVKMADVIDRYLSEVSPLRAASHQRNVEIAAHLKAFFGEAMIQDVRPPLVSSYKTVRLGHLTRKGSCVSPDTVRRELSLLRRIFNVAIDEWELCRENPVKKVIRSRKVASPYVFCDGKGKRYSPRQVSMAFRRACDRAGVKDLRLHDLRHDFATLMLRKRRNLVEVQHALGHKDPRMTLRYAHLLPEDLREAFEAIDGEGTASVISRFLHVEDKEKGVRQATL